MKLLIIDNKPLTGEMLSFMLKRERPEIEYVGQAYTARQGYRMAAELAPDVMIVDFAAPGMCEEAALCRLREQRPSAHIIVRTAFDEFTCIQQALRAGVSDYLLVPVRTEEMLDALDRCAGKRVAARARNRESAGRQGRDMEALLELLRDGQGTDAIQLAAQWLRSASREATVEELCSRCLEAATQLLQAPGQPRELQGELSILYQDLIRALARTDSLERLLEVAASHLNQYALLVSRSARDQSHHQINAAKDYIENHLGENLSLEKVASKLFLSPGYFSRLFKQKTGQTFSDYLACRRVDRAKILLATSDLQVSEIAKQIGYAEPNSFTRLFRSRAGVSPSQYRGQ